VILDSARLLELELKSGHTCDVICAVAEFMVDVDVVGVEVEIRPYVWSNSMPL
jgi:hypothetical protein